MIWGLGWLKRTRPHDFDLVVAAAKVEDSKREAKKASALGQAAKQQEALSLLEALRELGGEVDRGIEILENDCLRESGRDTQ